MLEGGVYLYPGEIKDGKKTSGKLRLLYEAAPLAYVVYQAGGLASTGSHRILEMKPTNLQQRVPLIIGSVEDVIVAEELNRKRGLQLSG
jgi:fructose-1,6-bisphosphatase I